ncbi:hypothetical protein [Natronococcus wangiae]|uniref:hypothetical protein n=1 Tax=Natronococcus wangiae TaxID=3068275 RepID=UPI00273DC03B|nr:hypothetical protein [Natronococcus sp. AD5]
MIVGGLGLWFCRLNKKQQHYLDIVNRERDELGEYDRLLKDYLPAEKLDRQARVERAETIARIGTARKQLTEVRRAVYREDYVSFLTAYYWANAQRIFIYDLLDAAELDDGSKRINWSLDIDLARLSGRQIREEGTIDVPATNRSGTRLWNLTKWLWLTSRSLPESEREEVNEYLLRDDNELKRSLSPQELYRALGVIHMWDIQRISDLMSIKRTLRYLVPALAALLVFVVATVHVNPGGFIDELAANGTVDGALFESWFVLLVVGTGILGALFSMALFMRDTTSQVTSYRSIPDPTILRETILVGLLIGGVSALFSTCSCCRASGTRSSRIRSVKTRYRSCSSRFWESIQSDSSNDRWTKQSR